MGRPKHLLGWPRGRGSTAPNLPSRLRSVYAQHDYLACEAVDRVRRPASRAQPCTVGSRVLGFRAR